MENDCLFCRIVNGDLEASVVHRDAMIMAFMDLIPVSPGHLLVIPVEHHEAITDLPAEVGARMWSFAHRAASAVVHVGKATGVNLWMAQGRDAQQSVFHSHLHVIPRVAGDGMVVSAPDRVADRAALDTVAEALRVRLAGSDPGISSHTPRETRAPK
ncbi:HIT family protein [Isoptericola sediminis]|uniref:HIT domain-containing protein n=1 Tax=Isoptericola sediminis TaxID=2733572 RepID=A0A849KBA2_9MICO|nr:HIT domain-containing protein [Isoptericola sediminis]NNU28517.1 HIT domain-containing protein [Isoptericola sediminis]